jgi:hypothetical protein
MNKRILTLGVLVVAAAVVVVGCSRTKTIKTDQGEITISDKGEMVKMEIKTEEGKDIKVNLGEQTLPSNLPKDIPIYNPSKVTASQMMGNKKVMLNLTTPDEAGSVTKFYEHRLKEDGWKLGRQMTMGPMAIMSGIKGNKKLNVTINRDDDEKETMISLIFAEE